jgi:type II secretory pathway component PulJ
MLTINEQVGFSLTELMLSLFLGSVLLSMVIGLYVAGVSNSAKYLKYSRLRTDVQSILTIIESDIRRASYGGARYLVGSGENKSIDILSSSPLECVVFSYDSALDGSVTNMGYRHSFTKKTIQHGTGLKKDALECYFSGSWENMSDPNFLKITHLKFTENITSSATAIVRNVNIMITGELVSDSRFAYSTNVTVQVRNFEFK